MSLSCPVFRGALLIPFSWDSASMTAREWLEVFKTRRQPTLNPDRAPALLWRERPAGGAHAEVRELNPTFQQLFGRNKEPGPEEGYASPWRSIRLDLTVDPNVAKWLFRDPHLWFKKKKTCIAPPRLGDVGVVLFPLGGGMLALHIDWVGGGEPLPVDEAVQALFVARHFRDEGSTPGWTFPQVSPSWVSARPSG